MTIIVDTSVLIYYFFGNKQEKAIIQKVLNSDPNLSITKIIKFEFRNIYLDFERLKQIIYIKTELVKNKTIEYFQFPSSVLEEFSKKYHYKSHTLGRIRLLFQNVLNEFFKLKCERSFRYLEEYESNDQFEQLLLDRIESIIYPDIKIPF